MAFTIVVHVATVCSTLVILWKEIDWIFRGFFKFRMNAETRYVINILISMIPIGIVGVLFKDYVEEIFGSGLLIVGCMLLLTAALLTFSYYYKQMCIRDRLSGVFGPVSVLHITALGKFCVHAQCSLNSCLLYTSRCV